ncbi:MULTISPECIES: S8 family peptidase [Exiguobacterium]|uniref:S8 family peptidase n=1 Tax=Exiguobacterium TaxID=33986 RepID=UPI001AEA8D62|nr:MULTISPECIES: S8 family peptidase [Exiguobacterium]MCT4780901.1 S8 family peptidase [Exiguobacterium soli]
MQKWLVGLTVFGLLGTAVPIQTEAAGTGAQKLPVLDAKTKKAYIKSTFDSKGKALFYFDTKTYLTGGTHLKFAADATEAVTVYESQTDYKQQLVYGRYDQVTNQSLIFPLSWSGRQYIEIEGKKNTAFVVPFKLERLQPIRETMGQSNTSAKASSLVVKMTGPSSQKQQLSEKTAAVKHETIDAELRLEKFTYRTVMQALAAKRELEQTRGVAYVELDSQMHGLGNDVFKSYQWSLNNTGQRGGVKGADINFDAMKKRITSKKQSTVLVAVIDTGINPTYADFAGRVRMDLGYDFVNRRQLAIDDHGHGSHIAGIIAANSNNTYGMSGINAKASIIPIKVLGEDNYGSNSNIAKGILHAVKKKAKVINISIGGGFSSRAIEDALAYAKKQGVLVVVAAGNEGTNKLSYPARSQYALSVGSSNRFDKRSAFSNYGEGLDLIAPGQDIPSYLSDGVSAFWSGTSMAAPHVAGVASLLYSLKPTIKASEVESILKKSAQDLGKKGYDSSYGYGRLDADRAVQLLR